MASGELEGAFMISKPFGARSSTIARQSFGPTTRIRSTITSPPEQHDNLITSYFCLRNVSRAHRPMSATGDYPLDNRRPRCCRWLKKRIGGLAAMDQRTVDFIIVGAGSAGAALANRLTENGRFRVLLLEAGGKTHWLSQVPISFARFINRPGVNWLYSSEPQDSTGGRAIPVPRGRMLGGS